MTPLSDYALDLDDVHEFLTAVDAGDHKRAAKVDLDLSDLESLGLIESLPALTGRGRKFLKLLNDHQKALEEAVQQEDWQD